MIQNQFHPSSTWNHHFAFTSTWKNKCRHYKPDGLWIKCNFDFFLFEMMVEHKLRNNIAIIIITNACILIPCSTIFFLMQATMSFQSIIWYILLYQIADLERRFELVFCYKLTFFPVPNMCMDTQYFCHNKMTSP